MELPPARRRAQFLDENRRRSKDQPEFELLDTGIFDDDRYFDVFLEFATAGPNDILMRVTVHNRGPEAAPVHVLPQLVLRNTWSWGLRNAGPIWFPVNYLLVESLQKFHHYYGDDFTIECPVGSGRMVTLAASARRTWPDRPDSSPSFSSQSVKPEARRQVLAGRCRERRKADQSRRMSAGSADFARKRGVSPMRIRGGGGRGGCGAPGGRDASGPSPRPA